MPLPYPSTVGNKPIQTLGASRTPAGAAYPTPGGLGTAASGGTMPGGPTYGQPGSLVTGPDGNVKVQPNKPLDPYDAPIRQVVQAGGLGYEQNGTIFVPGGQSGPSQPTMSTGGGGGGGGTGGAGGGSGDPGPGLSKDEIMSIINGLKPDAPPPREQAPGALQRIEAPQAVASPSAKSQGFARAKDNAGRVANSALQSLRSEMVNRGIEGSGVEGQLAGNVLGETARGVSDASFQQERAAEDQQWQAAQLGYQGAINQRGQDYGLAGQGFAGNVSQRGQDIGAQPNMLALAPTILGLLGRRY